MDYMTLDLEALDAMIRDGLICLQTAECDNCGRNDNNDGSCINGLLSDLVDAVSMLRTKETPQNVRNEMESDMMKHSRRGDCPVCGHRIGTLYRNPEMIEHYCCKCGQRIKWSFEEESNGKCSDDI